MVVWELHTLREKQNSDDKTKMYKDPPYTRTNDTVI